MCILIAAICDVLDGLFSRLLKTQSDLGAELDSLADFLSFGVAPGILVYFGILEELAIWGYLAVTAFIVFACRDQLVSCGFYLKAAQSTSSLHHSVGHHGYQRETRCGCQ